MKYEISYQNPHLHFINICLTISDISEDQLVLQCPSWRPGRYELANFAKNIQTLHAEDTAGGKILTKKISKDRWEVQTSGVHTIKVYYNYYAHQMDAGSSWLDEEQLYINFVNCMLYVPDRINEALTVHLQLPADYEIACGLEQPSKHTLQAPNYYRLVDSPMIASNKLMRQSFEVEGHQFHLWFMGTVKPDWDQIISDFKAYTRAQFATMKEFPCSTYHYLFQIVPYPLYHGVEHYNSTVITLGPDEDFHTSQFYKNLLGVSSHELFHTWNVIRIRPEEMMPYDFSKENYHNTGFVTEGVTTYYGDLFLGRAGVYSVQDYLDDLNKFLKRHFENPGRHNLSVAESSFDTWLDGYVQGIPDRKVSIYVKGAIAALLLDLELRKESLGEKSLDDVMQAMWKKYGKAEIGYSFEDYRKTAEEIAGVSLKKYFDDIILGKIPVEDRLSELLPLTGCVLNQTAPSANYEGLFGFKVTDNQQSITIQSLYPNSPAAQQLALNDEIIAVNGRKVNKNFEKLISNLTEVKLSFFRNNQLKEVTLKNKGETFYNYFQVSLSKEPSSNQAMHFEKWLGQAHPYGSMQQD